MFDLAPLHPDPWPGPAEYQPNSDLACDGNFLSEDFCVIDGRYFLVRCVLEIPVHGLARSFAFGCWGTLSRDNFDIFVKHFDAGDYAGLGPWTSWLCNDLAGLVGPKPIGCEMFPQLDRQRPVLRVMDPEHPLAVMQDQGISADDVMAFYSRYGHSLD